jgi:cytochrome c-type biogenesis protein CcmE
MSRRVRLTLASAGIAVALVLLMVTAIRAASAYYYTLPQFRALGSAAVGPFVKVNGSVGQDVRWDPLTQELTFEIVAASAAPGSGAEESAGGAAVAPLPVVYRGPEPDTFKPGISVVVAGRLDPSGTFSAEQVLVKCPSHYEAALPTSA